jgi:integrase
MASFKQLPSGLWQAKVVTPIKLPSGQSKRISKTFPLKAQAENWAKRQEGAIAAGTWTDPRGADITLAEYREVWRDDKLTAGRTLQKVDSFWRNHIEGQWGGYPLNLITRPELKPWVKRISEQQCKYCHACPGTVEDDDGLVLVEHRRPPNWRERRQLGRSLRPDTTVKCVGSGEPPGLGPWTVQGIVSHLSSLLTSAVQDGKLAANPAVKLELPTTVAKPVFYWTPDEASQILLELGGLDALAVDLDMYVGLRPGELFGLRARFVDRYLWQISVHGVSTRSGWRPYAKTKKSHRVVPIPVHLRARIADRLDQLEPDDLVFPRPDGRLWDDRDFARLVFNPAVERAGVRPGTPYDMRHTAASWLVQRGVELQRVQELLGHEKYSTTLRYAHLRPKAFDAVLDAWGSAPLDPRAGTGAHEVPTGPPEGGRA